MGKDQQQCGSCAAFAAVAAADSCMWMASNSLYDDLSEQHLMDCANGHFSYDDEGSWGAFGCDGAWPQAYYDWVIKQNDGRLEKEDCAPYQAKDRTCVDDDSCNYMGAHMTGFWNKWHTTEDEMKELVFQAPVATTVYASYFGDYGGGFMKIADVARPILTPTASGLLTTRLKLLVMDMSQEKTTGW